MGNQGVVKLPTSSAESLGFETIVEPISHDLRSVDQTIFKYLDSEVDIIPLVGRYLVGNGGKRIRPALCLLSCQMCGVIGPRPIRISAALELIHTSTLLHDDVVDNAELRRGQKSANQIWGNRASILIGDFVYAQACAAFVDDGDLRILQMIANMVSRMTEGEILQQTKLGDIDITEEDYMRIIKAKTAILLSSGSQAGAIISKQSHEKEMALAAFGHHLGMAFQLIDDCLDYAGDEQHFGKEIGHDLFEGKITLPLIRAIGKATVEEVEKIKHIVNGTEDPKSGLEFVSHLITKYEGLGYTHKLAKQYIEIAKTYLDVFDDHRAKTGLIDLANYIGCRSR